MEKIPHQLLSHQVRDINIFNYKSSHILSRNKVILEQHVISFLIEGHKKVHFTEKTMEINNTQALMMLKSNCLMTEQILTSLPYNSILLFFSEKKLNEFIIKHQLTADPGNTTFPQPAFRIEKDEFINAYIQTISILLKQVEPPSLKFLETKFEEILLYLLEKYGHSFSVFLKTSVSKNEEISFKTIVEANKLNVLSLEEIAFLCNMSVSTFKRHFEKVYHQSPGKWFKTQKLMKAREILQLGEKTPSEVHEDFGYESLSNFSSAFKKEFGVNPNAITK